MVEPIRSGGVRGHEVGQGITRDEMIEALKHGDIYKVLQSVNRADFEEFMGNQYQEWAHMLQDYQICSIDGSAPPPEPVFFPIHDNNARLTDEERTIMLNSLRRSFGKAMKAEGAATGDAEEPPTLAGTAEETLSEYEQFMTDVTGYIIDAQAVQDYEARMGEIKQEAERIIELAKSGRISAEFVLIMLAKVNSTKNGVMLTWLGKKAFNLNSQLNEIASGLDPSNLGDLQVAQSKTRDGTFQMNLLMTDTQKLMQNIESCITFTQSSINEINRTKREIIQAVAAR